MNILGISCFCHDSASCLVRDGDIVAAVQEELFTRNKHDENFPHNAIRWCLRAGRISAQELDYVVFYEKPIIKFERLIETFLMYAPSGICQFRQAIPVWLKQNLWISDIIRKNLGYKGNILFATHHESHAASAFYPSPFKEAAILTFDGVGEWETASIAVGNGNDIRKCSYLSYPHSLGLLYSAFTYYLGFKINSGENKLMDLAAYGEPVYVKLIMDHLIDLKEDGSFKLNMEYFGYCNTMRMINARFEKIFGGPPRIPGSKITQKHINLAASIQKVTEDIILRIVKHVHAVTGQNRLCLAGGVALNYVSNSLIMREGPFEDIWIQSASSDAGGALGAALLVWYKYLKNERIADDKQDREKASFLGPEFSDDYIKQFLIEKEIPFRQMSYVDIPKVVSDLIIQGNVIGWFQGRGEFGPGGLGARSIIGDARNPQMKSKLNLRIKYQESFLSLTSTVLREYVSEWFNLNRESSYMLLLASVCAEKRLPLYGTCRTTYGLDRLKHKRLLIPAVTHVDYSARFQTIRRDDQPLFYDTIKEFYRKTGCPVIINTSFNIQGEPPSLFA